jgi:prevent-host-death family protein
MNFSTRVKPISYLKAHLSEVVNDFVEEPRAMYVTQNGEVKAVLQDIETYERTQESLALLKILAQSCKSKAEGKIKPAKKAFADIRKRIGTLE